MTAAPPPLDPASRALHADDGVEPDSGLAPPIHVAATFAAADDRAFAAMASEPRHPRYYTRYGNPTHARAEAVIASLEGTESAMLFASGMGAMASAVLSQVQAGDHVVAQRNHYMGTTRLLESLLGRFGVATSFVDQTDPAAFAAAIRPQTRLVVVETPANPVLSVTDLEAIAALARRHGLATVCDATLLTPVNGRPADHGIDLIVHSATKYLAGHHDVTAGVVAGSRECLERVWQTAIVLGATAGPIDAWLLLRGLRTLPLRMARINASALAVARHLAAHPRIARVHYPGLQTHPQHALAARQMSGFSGVVAFEVDGDYARTQAMLAGLQLVTQGVSLGGVDSLAVHAAAMWAGTLGDDGLRAAGIAPNFVRLSVGLEAPEDLVADLDRALAAC